MSQVTPARCCCADGEVKSSSSVVKQLWTKSSSVISAAAPAAGMVSSAVSVASHLSSGVSVLPHLTMLAGKAGVSSAIGAAGEINIRVKRNNSICTHA